LFIMFRDAPRNDGRDGLIPGTRGKLLDHDAEEPISCLSFRKPPELLKQGRDVFLLEENSTRKPSLRSTPVNVRVLGLLLQGNAVGLQLPQKLAQCLRTQLHLAGKLGLPPRLAPE
jgi:hypothetical protein